MTYVNDIDYCDFRGIVQGYVYDCCENGTEPDLNEFSRMHAVRELDREKVDQAESLFVKFAAEWKSMNGECVSA